MRTKTDYLVLGSGHRRADLRSLCGRRGRVTVVTKRTVNDAATAWAQGGIAAVLAPDDSFGEHAADTLTTGGGLSHRQIVEMVVEDGPARIEALLELGVHFSATRDSSPDLGQASLSGLDLAREGGHGKRRVVHAGDITGAEVQRALLDAVAAQPNIEVLADHMAIDLIDLARMGGPRRIIGAYVLDQRSHEVHALVANATVLATGGAGKVYLYTTNPTSRPVTAWPWPIARAPRSRTWSSSSSTPPASTTLRPRTS
jgi:L-aspartate oxidase